ncbi:MAG TPA: hypothetical protein VMT46_07550 [Anaerolineaceae bacterium]|nr:hypothetical protein [Anaerolineaceae bacterium]
MGLTQTVLDRSRTIAENADSLSFAVAKNDQYDIDASLNDLIVAYDQYAHPAAAFSGSFAFSEAAGQPGVSVASGGQTVNAALASSLVDLQVANLLTKAAQASGEIEGQADAAAISESVTNLNDTIQALQGRAGAATGPARYSFGESSQAEATPAPASPDLLTAKNTYLQLINDIYASLLADSIVLLTGTFKGLDQLDLGQVQQGVKQALSFLNLDVSGKFLSRIVDAVQRSFKTLRDMAGDQAMQQIEDRVNKEIGEVKKGEKALQAFLIFAYQADQSQKSISGWLETTNCGIAEIDTGRQRLVDLHSDQEKTFNLFNQIISALHSLSSPIEWILKKAGGTAPLDLVMACLLFIVVDFALLRGMDFADTTTLLKFVDGTLTISRQALNVK